MSLLYGNILAFNFTAICMVLPGGIPNNNESSTHDNSSTLRQYAYSPWEVNLLFSAMAVGCLLGSVPLAFLISHYGMKWVWERKF